MNLNIKHVLLGVGLVLFLFTAKSASAATLTLNPGSGTYTSGQSFTADIVLDSQGALYDGVDIFYLRFDPTVLQVTDSNPDVDGVQILTNNLLPFTVVNSVDNVNGLIQFSQSIVGGSSGISSSGTLASVWFRTISAGTSNVSFDFTAGNTADSNVARLGVDLLTAVNNASITVNAPILPTASISVTPSTVEAGVAATLSWSTTNASLISINQGIGVVSASGSMSVSPSTDTTYVITASNAFGASTAQILLAVTMSPVGDTVPPVISNVQVNNIASGSAQITWTTNEPSTSQVEYGSTTSYGRLSLLNANLVTNHSVKISKLTANTQYNFRVLSKDAASNQAQSSNNTFTTLPKRGKSPKPNRVTATSGSIVITWDEPTEYYSGVLIDRSTQGFLMTHNPSMKIAEFSQGASENRFVDNTSVSGQVYYYTLFTYDDVGNYSDPAGISFRTQTDVPASNVTYKDGTLVLDKGVIYIIELGQKRAFSSMAVFRGLGYSLTNVLRSNIDHINSGTGIVTATERHSRGNVVIDQGTIYFMGKDLRYAFPSSTVFLAWGNRFVDVIPANTIDLSVASGPIVSMPTSAPAESAEVPIGTTVKFPSSATVYLVLPNNKLQPYNSSAQFTAEGRKFKDVIQLNENYKNKFN